MENPLKRVKKAIAPTGAGRVGRGLDKIVRESILEGKGGSAYKEGLNDVAKGIYGTDSKDARQIDPLAKPQEEKRKAEAEAEELAKRAAGRYDDIELPGESTQYDLPDTLQFDRLTQDGYQADRAEAVTQGDSKYGDIELDPKFAESQMAALSGLQDSVNSGGMSDADIANLAKVQSDVGRADRGRREAIQDRMRRQGMSGSGLDLLQQLSSGQAATDRASQAGLDIAGAASNRLRQDTRDLGAMATGLRDQSFGEQSESARAADSIAQFNAANKQSTNFANQDAQNQARQFGANASNQAKLFNTQGANNTNQFNLQNKQNVNQANVDMKNHDQQRGFNNEMGLQSARANADLGHATNRQASADRAARQEGQIIGGLGEVVGTAASYVASDENLKTQIEPISEAEVEEFLQAVQPKKFKYKNRNHGEGQRVGVMAQDLEKSQIGQSIVQDTPEGKILDNNNLLGAIVDSLGHLNKKIDKDDEPVMITGGN